MVIIIFLIVRSQNAPRYVMPFVPRVFARMAGYALSQTIIRGEPRHALTFSILHCTIAFYSFVLDVFVLMASLEKPVIFHPVHAIQIHVKVDANASNPVAMSSAIIVKATGCIREKTVQFVCTLFNSSELLVHRLLGEATR